MRICLEVGGEELDLEVQAREDATAADLVAALTGEAAGDAWLAVNGTPVHPATLLVSARICDGAAVSITGVPALVPAGRDAATLPPSPAPTPPAATGQTTSASAAGEVIWWRPPRAPLPPVPPPVAPAAEPPPVPEPGRLSWPMLVAPAAVAAALAVLLDPRLAVIALVGPVAQLASWLDDRRRHRRARRRAETWRAAELERVARDEAAAAALAQTRSLAAAPHVGELVTWALERGPRLWERRRHHDDFLHLRGVPDDAAAVGIDSAGDRCRALAVARNLVVQAVVLHGPADLGLAIASGAAEADDWEWAKWLPHLRATASATFTVVDVADPAAARAAVSGIPANGRAVVLGHTDVPLPDACGAVISAGAAAIEGLDFATARAAARSLAAVRDGDAIAPKERQSVGHRSGRRDGVPSPEAHLGTTHGGLPFVVDLVNDGPHVLVAGTTGSGKSELLRVLVAGLASAVPPEALNFVLVDYKGGSAFDACARLPHVAGLVTDLDDALAARALRCLHAELRYREQTLRDAGVTDIEAHQAARRGGVVALPRLVVVIDEFAALTADVPGFVPALVEIAQRGRSLGVHLVLATQRPAGVVSDAIRANVGLRIALRTSDAGESADVIGVPDAAYIARERPGRAIARFDADRVVRFDTMTLSRAHAPDSPAVRIRPFVLRPVEVHDAPPSTASERTELDVLVDRVRDVARRRGSPPPRAPWPDPLPATLSLHDLEGDDALGLLDDPDGQTRHTYRWRGTNLLTCGTLGSGHTDLLPTVAAALARVRSPGELHIYAIDDAAGVLRDLTALPHVGAVIAAADSERSLRLLRTLDRRVRRGAADGPTTLVLFADLPALLAALDDGGMASPRQQLDTILTAGHAANVVTVAAAARPGAVPAAVAATFPERLVFRLTDPQDATLFGVTAPPAPAPSGRAVDVITGLELQIAGADFAWDKPWPEGDCPPPIGVLPESVRLDDVEAATAPPGPGLWLPIGIGDDELSPCGLLLQPGDHVVIAGPARGGKTTLLGTIAASARRRGVIVTSDVEVARRATSACVLVLDDADALDDDSGAIAALLARRRSTVHVVAAARTDRLQAAYGHWTRELRAARHAVLLGPRPDDGDLFGLLLPRSHRPLPEGRGYLIVDGRPHLFQAANLRQ